MLVKRKRCTLLATFVLLGTGGCYRYAEVPIESMRVGTPVRARITGAEAERLEPVLGNAGRSIDGSLLENGDSAIVIAVASPVSPEGGATVSRALQRIALPRTELEEVQVRHLDRFRTTLALVGAAAGVGVAVAAVSQVIQLGSGADRPSPNKSRVPPIVPVLRLRFTR